jgi:hypothetical protein
MDRFHNFLLSRIQAEDSWRGNIPSVSAPRISCQAVCRKWLIYFITTSKSRLPRITGRATSINGVTARCVSSWENPLQALCQYSPSPKAPRKCIVGGISFSKCISKCRRNAKVLDSAAPRREERFGFSRPKTIDATPRTQLVFDWQGLEALHELENDAIEGI